MLLRASIHLVIATLLATSLWVSSAKGADFLSTEQRTEDFASFCRFVADEYAYFDRKQTDWGRACRFYAPQVASAPDWGTYIEILERALGELYDPHAHLGTNTARSYRLVPSQADLFAMWSNGSAIITEVRSGSGAQAAGLLAGMEVVALNDEPIAALVSAIAPKFLAHEDPAAREWALQLALAGRRDRNTIKLLTKTGDKLHEFEFAPTFPEPTAPLSYRVVGKVGHIRLHNSLGQKELIPAFDQAIAQMAAVQALVIDLRDTPSGGNSSVARGIMGRLVNRTLPYQRHELVSEFRSTGIGRVWVEYVTPRNSPFLKPVVVLVGRWTGSMGEGLALGVNATRGAPVVGQPMAQLLGAIGETTLPHSKIVVRLPVEKLFHIDGTPREAFVPCAIDQAGPASPSIDRELGFAVELALRLSTLKSNRSMQRTCPGKPGRVSHVKR